MSHESSCGLCGERLQLIIQNTNRGPHKHERTKTQGRSLRDRGRGDGCLLHFRSWVSRASLPGGTGHRIPFKPQQEIVILYKGEALKKKYVADFICYGQIIIELKALEALCGRDVGQLLNYMKATRFNVGLLINFGSPVRLEWHRYVI